ncbi:ComEC/Rec2 family competence protein [Actinotalea sp. M2MS4P-6]|uniref:ComEC/Rec2 family competence protein n=1 Tax=Actinotalea sp. M2MS4P-6 TaxID=2983762 RepID=UPI0021E48164|nr:ComEC/Rec2 family competence protein [Actinotalea sp. M2MS4P-6]MCV2393949.1 ComEC/Rec2 family competence protein [Actinotalea sp. M2MS4P-6]
MSERPVDLRLLPAAVGSWCAAGLGVHAQGAAGPTPALLAVIVVLGMIALALVVVCARRPSAGGVGRGARRAAGSRDELRRSRRPRPRHRRPAPVRDVAGATLVAVAAVTAVLVSCAAHLEARADGPLLEAAEQRATAVVEGVVVGEAAPAPVAWDRERVSAVVLVDQVAARGRTGRAAAEVLVTGDAAWLDVPLGARVSVLGRLAPLDGRRPAVLATGAFEVLAAPGAALGAVARLRSGLRTATASLDGDAAALVPGVAIGDVSRVTPELTQAMRVAGLSHLVAVSGQHVAIVLLAVMALAGAARAPRWLRAVLAGAAVISFALLVGPGASVLRAAVMGGVGALALALGRPSWPLPALGVAVVGLLVADPWAAGSLGFQLSVLATVAIVLLAGPSARAVHERWPPQLRTRPSVGALAVLTVPLAAQSAVAPVLVLVDPVVSPWAVPANVVAAPAVVPATLLGLTATVLEPVWSGGAVMVARVAAYPAAWLGTVARATAGLPGAATPWREGALGALGLAALLAAAWLAGRVLLVPATARASRHGAA